MLQPIDTSIYSGSGDRYLGEARQELVDAVVELQARIDSRASSKLPAGARPPFKSAARSTAALAQYLNDEEDRINNNRATSSIYKLTLRFKLLRYISQTYSLLLIADRQRSGNLTQEQSKRLSDLDTLIDCAYAPVRRVMAAENFVLQPEDLVGVFSEDQYLSRPKRPVPYVIVPCFLRDLPWSWNGVVHEVGHHIYTQLGFLRYELDVVVANALASAQPALPYEVQRLWFHWLQEAFCDLYGVLLLGEAYILSQFAIFMFDRLPFREKIGGDNSARPTQAELDAQEEAIQRNLLRDPSGNHPAPALRGAMVIAALEKLSGVKASGISARWLTGVVDVLKANNWKVEDPHGGTSVTGPAELDYGQVEQGMQVVMKALLDTPMLSFNCQCKLSSLVNFEHDETVRGKLKAAILSDALSMDASLQEVQDYLDHLAQAGDQDAAIDPQDTMRLWIAALHGGHQAKLAQTHR